MSPSPPAYTTVRSISALYLNRATTAEIILDAENRIAIMPASRAMSSSPGSDSSVTDALRMTADYVPEVSSPLAEKDITNGLPQDKQTRR